MKTFVRIVSGITLILFILVTIIVLGIDNPLVFLTWACVTGIWSIFVYLDLIQEIDERRKSR